HSALPATPLLALSPDGRSFAASAVSAVYVEAQERGASNANTVQSSVELYSTSLLRRVATISMASGRSVGAGAWAGKRFVLGADRGLVQLWDVADGTPAPRAVLRGLSKQGQVTSIATADGGRLVAAAAGWSGPPPQSGGPPPQEGELAIWRDGKLVGDKPLNL